MRRIVDYNPKKLIKKTKNNIFLRGKPYFRWKPTKRCETDIITLKDNIFYLLPFTKLRIPVKSRMFQKLTLFPEDTEDIRSKKIELCNFFWENYIELVNLNLVRISSFTKPIILFIGMNLWGIQFTPTIIIFYLIYILTCFDEFFRTYKNRNIIMNQKYLEYLNLIKDYQPMRILECGCIGELIETPLENNISLRIDKFCNSHIYEFNIGINDVLYISGCGCINVYTRVSKYRITWPYILFKCDHHKNTEDDI